MPGPTPPPSARTSRSPPPDLSEHLRPPSAPQQGDARSSQETSGSAGREGRGHEGSSGTPAAAAHDAGVRPRLRDAGDGRDEPAAGGAGGGPVTLRDHDHAGGGGAMGPRRSRRLREQGG